MTEVNLFRNHLESVYEDIKSACTRAQRPWTSIRVIGVTKTVGPNSIGPLLEAGLTDFGENRWQQAREKLELPASQQATWHFIGRLQSNKVKYIVPRFDWVHSIDSLALAEEISRRAEQANRVINGLIQVNTSGEISKAGIEPKEVQSLLQQARSLPSLEIRGLMTMAPHFEDVEEARPTFVRLRECLLEARTTLDWPELTELSMGMSNDFTVAIEEGATLVRIGRRIMGG